MISIETVAQRYTIERLQKLCEHLEDVLNLKNNYLSSLSTLKQSTNFGAPLKSNINQNNENELIKLFQKQNQIKDDNNNNHNNKQITTNYTNTIWNAYNIENIIKEFINIKNKYLIAQYWPSEYLEIYRNTFDDFIFYLRQSTYNCYKHFKDGYFENYAELLPKLQIICSDIIDLLKVIYKKVKNQIKDDNDDELNDIINEIKAIENLKEYSLKLYTENRFVLLSEKRDAIDKLLK
mgnify:CR=1 FL=1